MMSKDDIVKAMRQGVVTEALTWQRTPWHHMAQVKGAGVDCAQILVAVYHACGLVPKIDLGYYTADFHMHRGDETYITKLLEYTHEVDAPLPGDIVGFRYGRPKVSHAGIVVRWPTIVHAHRGEGVVLADASKDPLASRLVGFFSFWE